MKFNLSQNDSLQFTFLLNSEWLMWKKKLIIEIIVSCPKEHWDLPLSVTRALARKSHLRPFTVTESISGAVPSWVEAFEPLAQSTSDFQSFPSMVSSDLTPDLSAASAWAADVPGWQELTSLGFLLPSLTLWFFTALIAFLVHQADVV